jgi:probable phosphoglycerate mutase
MRAIFIRHGESTGNAGIPSHNLSQISLTDRGLAQASKVAEQWVERPGLIGISPYLRTHLTAKPTIQRFPDVPVEVLPMQEFTYLEPSRWNGTSRIERLPHIEAYWQTADPDYRDGPGAESFSTLLSRVDATFAHMEQLDPASLVLAFSHGQFMQALRVSLMFPSWSEKQKMEHYWPFNRQYPIRNCDLMEATMRSQGQWTVNSRRARIKRSPKRSED